MCLGTTAALTACTSTVERDDLGEKMFSLSGQVESRLTRPVGSAKVALGFLSENDAPLKFQAVAVTDSFPSQFQLDVFAPPEPDIPTLVEGTTIDPATGEANDFKISTARIFVVSADSDLDDPASVEILGWDPAHLVFYTSVSRPELPWVTFGGMFVRGDFQAGYALAVGNARPPAQYEADRECHRDLDLAFHPPTEWPESVAAFEEHRRQIDERCHGGASDNIRPAPDGLETLLTVPMVDDPFTTLGVLHPRGSPR